MKPNGDKLVQQHGDDESMEEVFLETIGEDATVPPDDEPPFWRESSDEEYSDVPIFGKDPIIVSRSSDFVDRIIAAQVRDPEYRQSLVPGPRSHRLLKDRNPEQSMGLDLRFDPRLTNLDNAHNTVTEQTTDESHKECPGFSIKIPDVTTNKDGCLRQQICLWLFLAVFLLFIVVVILTHTDV